MPRKHSRSVRVVKLEVGSMPNYREASGRWFVLLDRCGEVVNALWQHWLAWHLQNNSRVKIRTWLAAVKEHGKEKAGNFPVVAIPAELNKQLYYMIQTEFPDIHGRVQNLLQNIWARDLNVHKAARGNLKGWAAILLYRQQVPTCRSHPVPFDTKNAKIIPPTHKKEPWRVEFRIFKADGTAILDSVPLYCPGKGTATQMAQLAACASGKFIFKGSNLIYIRDKKKWFVHVCYQRSIEEKPQLDPERVAVLRAGTDDPWILTVPGDKKGETIDLKILGVGDRESGWVAQHRRKIYHGRRSRAAKYRHASASKGHGRKRNDQWRGLFQQAWKRFVHTANHTATQRAIQECVKRGCGTIAYEQPTGDVSESRFLSTSGKGADWKDQTTWEWFQVGTMLKYKGNDLGVTVVVQKVGVGEEDEQEAAAEEVAATKAPAEAKAKKNGKPKTNGKVPEVPDRSPQGRSKRRSTSGSASR